MSEWKEYKLGEVTVKITSGGTPKSSEASYYGGNIPWLNTKEVNFNRITKTEKCITEDGLNNSSAKWIPKGSVIIAMYGATAAKVAYSLIDLTTNQACCNLIINNDIADSQFVYYYIQSSYEELLNLACGAAQQNLSVGVIADFSILLPPLDEQKRIASILSSLDDKIDLLHRENKTLEAMAETLFRQWFIEEAKEDWKEGKLGDYVNETIGGEWGKENPEGDFTKVVQCIRGTDIADLNIGLANKAPIRFVKESKFEKIEPRNGDIIMEISGGTENQSTGRVVYINEDVKTFFQYPIVFSNFCRLLRVDEKYSYFLYCYLKYLYDQDEYFNLENGSSGIKNLDYKALLYDLTYPMPKDKRIIFKFNDNVSLYFKRINKNKKQIQTLTQTRDSLLPKLMSGEIKV